MKEAHNKKEIGWKRDGDCIVVTSHKPNSNDGYIYISRGDRRHIPVHRLVCERRHGLHPGMDTLHSCDNRACINPEHVTFGTRLQNMGDCSKRGRTSRGIKRPNAKLTDSQVLEIRNSKEIQQRIADRLGISQGIVSDIKARKRWSHL